MDDPPASWKTRVTRYWDIPFDGEKDTQRSDADWINAFATALKESVTLRLNADVPVHT